MYVQSMVRDVTLIIAARFMKCSAKPTPQQSVYGDTPRPSIHHELEAPLRVYDRLHPILRLTKKINAVQATRLIVSIIPSVKFSSNGNESVATC